MKILITGATGFIGSELVRQVLATGAEVRILRRDTSRLDLLGEAAGHVEHAMGDVTDTGSLRQAMAGVQQVYHVAAFVGFGGKKDRAALFRINVGGTAKVVNAALAMGVERLVHTSSLAAFGRPEQPVGAIDETAVWHASRVNTQYAISKHKADLEIYRGLAEGLDAVMVNPALIFGVGRPGENTREIVENVRDGKIPAVPVGGTNVVDVRDVATGHLAAMRHGRTGERYFLGSENLRWRTIFDTIADALGVAPPRRTLSPGPALGLATAAEILAFATRTRPRLTRELARSAAKFYTYSNRKATEELGCTFRPFKETAAWMAEVLRA